jgi:hypothetical protein
VSLNLLKNKTINPWWLTGFVTPPRPVKVVF